jgi:hypothetical protein
MTNSQTVHTLHRSSHFPTTHWSLVIVAGDPHCKDAGSAGRHQEFGRSRRNHSGERLSGCVFLSSLHLIVDAQYSSALGDDQGDVVMLLCARAESPNFFHDGGDNGLGRVFGILAQGPD